MKSINIVGKIHQVISALKEVYKNPWYIVLSLCTFILAIVVNIGAVNYELYFSFPSFEIVKNVFFGTFSTLPLYSIFSLFLTATLTALFLPLLVYHVLFLKSMSTVYATGSSGMLLGLIAPACASCGIGLAALLGLTGIMASFPFGGIEIVLLGVVLLVWAIIFISGKIVNKTCTILPSSRKEHNEI